MELRVLCIGIFFFMLLVNVGAVALSVSTTTLAASGDNVTISWKDLDSPTAIDWLGIYTPPESSDENFIGYIFLSSAAGWETGKGSYTLPAVNMRAGYEFRLFRGYPATEDSPLDDDKMPIPSTKTRLAVSEVVKFSNWNEITQVRLSYTSKPTEMAVMCVTKDPVKVFVRYGTRSDNLVHTGSASSQTYEQRHMCAAPANSSRGWRDPGFIHLATMTELKPGVRYFYQMGSEETGWSNKFSFVASYENGNTTDALLFGDMGTYVPYRTFNWVQYESVNTMKWLARDLDALGDKPSLVSHIGDISYARGYAWLWDNFFQQIEPVAARVPWHVCIGNHEYDWPEQPWKPDWSPYGKDGGGECGVPYSVRFTMPGTSSLPVGSNDAPDTTNLYFSLDFGVVHFVWISTETNFLPGSDQYNWIVNDLKSVDRVKTPFIVFQGHRPMYSTDNKAMSIVLTLKLIEHLEPLLVEHKVSVALWGHVHKYERTCALQNFTCMEGGTHPVHLVIGMGGQDWQPIDQPRADRPTAPIFPQPVWSLFRSFEFGYIRLHATRSLMRVEYVGNHDGKVHDVVEFVSPVAIGDDDDEQEVRLGDQSSSVRDQVATTTTSDVSLYSAFPVALAFVLGAALTGVTVTMFSRKAFIVRVPAK
jgi:hypothetical protein